MAQKETRHRQGSGAHPTSTAGIDTTESGPSRVHAAGKPHELESGPSRTQRHISAFGRPSSQGMRPAASTRPRIGGGLDTTEAGPARIDRYRK